MTVRLVHYCLRGEIKLFLIPWRLASRVPDSLPLETALFFYPTTFPAWNCPPLRLFFYQPRLLRFPAPVRVLVCGFPFFPPQEPPILRDMAVCNNLLSLSVPTHNFPEECRNKDCFPRVCPAPHFHPGENGHFVPLLNFFCDGCELSFRLPQQCDFPSPQPECLLSPFH